MSSPAYKNICTRRTVDCLCLKAGRQRRVSVSWNRSQGQKHQDKKMSNHGHLRMRRKSILWERKKPQMVSGIVDDTPSSREVLNRSSSKVRLSENLFWMFDRNVCSIEFSVEFVGCFSFPFVLSNNSLVFQALYDDA